MGEKKARKPKANRLQGNTWEHGHSVVKPNHCNSSVSRFEGTGNSVREFEHRIVWTTIFEALTFVLSREE